jgi:hypothetical protein
VLTRFRTTPPFGLVAKGFSSGRTFVFAYPRTSARVRVDVYTKPEVEMGYVYWPVLFILAISFIVSAIPRRKS